MEQDTRAKDRVGSTDKKCQLKASGKGFWITPPSGNLEEFRLVPDEDG